jgi:hypothetical protein
VWRGTSATPRYALGSLGLDPCSCFGKSYEEKYYLCAPFRSHAEINIAYMSRVYRFHTNVNSCFSSPYDETQGGPQHPSLPLYRVSVKIKVSDVLN